MGGHMIGDGGMTYDDERAAANTLRREIAQELVARARDELGDALRAAAIYGSVAHEAADVYSDVEIVLVTDDTLERVEEHCFARGVMVEVTRLPASRMLAAARRVGEYWGVQADEYRHQLVLYDADGFFPALWRAARELPDEAFAAALRETWWYTFESRGKLRNAVRAGERARIGHGAWHFAYGAAMRIALKERAPYESARTIWDDVRRRGYGMPALLDALVVGEPDAISAAVEAVWEQMRGWEPPASE